jgi:hypothetical protein
LPKWFLFIGLLFFSPTSAPVVTLAADQAEQTIRLLPDVLGGCRAQGAARPVGPDAGGVSLAKFSALAAAERKYLSAMRGAMKVTVVRTRSDSGAYAMLADVRLRAKERAQTVEPADIGTEAFATSSQLIFFKGPVFVIVEGADDAARRAVARPLADSLDGGEGEIPVLVKHLPEWETAQDRASYAVSLPALQAAAGNQPIFAALEFENGTEAITAPYMAGRLVIIEYTTPQIAASNDARIREQINQLRAGGQPVPSAYRRVGNYSVFVFDAPDEKAAAQLAEGVKYEQVVRWLGDNPRALERAQRAYSLMTASIIVTTIKATGLALLISLGVGSIFGSYVFMRRRARQAYTKAYSDAGGMVRLNIDEMTTQANPARLLGKGSD